MTWINTSENLPPKAGRYFVVTTAGKKKTCIYYPKTKTFTDSVSKWLDESPTPAVIKTNIKEIEKAFDNLVSEVDELINVYCTEDEVPDAIYETKEIISEIIQDNADNADTLIENLQRLSDVDLLTDANIKEIRGIISYNEDDALDVCIDAGYYFLKINSADKLALLKEFLETHIFTSVNEQDNAQTNLL